MPVASFVRGAQPGTADGVVHAAEPQDATSVCGGLALELEPGRRSFVPWDAAACPRCSETLDPSAAPTPAEEPSGPAFGGTA